MSDGIRHRMTTKTPSSAIPKTRVPRTLIPTTSNSPNQQAYGTAASNTKPNTIRYHAIRVVPDRVRRCVAGRRAVGLLIRRITRRRNQSPRDPRLRDRARRCLRRRPMAVLRGSSASRSLRWISGSSRSPDFFCDSVVFTFAMKFSSLAARGTSPPGSGLCNWRALARPRGSCHGVDAWHDPCTPGLLTNHR